MEINITTPSETVLNIKISEKIDTTTAPELDKALSPFENNGEIKKIVLDFESVNYISSIGLRILLRLKKQNKEVTVVNVSPEVYEIFEMTGFTQLVEVQKSYSTVSIEGCEIIGQGKNGCIYRLNNEEILKLYKKNVGLDEIIAERKHAKYAFLKGIPSAISFDIVKVGDNYGPVFELLDVKPLSKIIEEKVQEKENGLDEVVPMYVELLKSIHDKEYGQNDIELPFALESFKKLVGYLQDRMPEKYYEMLVEFSNRMPDARTLIHGDPQPHNAMLSSDGLVFIDMDTLSVGDPLFDFGCLYCTMVTFREFEKEDNLFNFSNEVRVSFWEKSFDLYYSGMDEKKKAEYKKMCIIFAYARFYAYIFKHPCSIFSDKAHLTLERLMCALDDFFTES